MLRRGFISTLIGVASGLIARKSSPAADSLQMVLWHHELEMDGKVFTITHLGPWNNGSFGMNARVTFLRSWSTEIPKAQYRLRSNQSSPDAEG